MKLSKPEAKMHEKVMDLIHGTDRRLTPDEVIFCYEWYNPQFDTAVMLNGIYFTPIPIATQLASMSYASGRIVDLCAGIGVLSWALMRHNYVSREITEIVAVENNEPFVKVGMRLLPEVRWVCGDVFDEHLIASLGTFKEAVSNPPYGNIKAKEAGGWMEVKSPAHLAVAEIALRITQNGGTMILPEVDVEYNLRHARPQESQNLARLKKAFRGVGLVPTVELDHYAHLWKGASPKVVLTNLTNDITELNLPVGLVNWEPSPYEGDPNYPVMHGERRDWPEYEERNVRIPTTVTTFEEDTQGDFQGDSQGDFQGEIEEEDVPAVVLATPKKKEKPPKEPKPKKEKAPKPEKPAAKPKRKKEPAGEQLSLF